ncbi:MAG: AAA family ATPase [Flavobacterium sp.]|nr:AAA family ATPase [Flavobacterium sp.]
MTSVPIYIKSLVIKNIRRFEKANINFVREDGILPQWTLILGDNGIGKTSILQSIAWMKPLVHDAKDPDGIKIQKNKIEPSINNEDNETLEQLVNNNNFLNAKIHATYIANLEFNKKSDLSNEKICTSEIIIKLDKEFKLHKVPMKFDTNAEDIFFDREVLILPYSASRRLGKTNLYESNLTDPFVLFNADDTQLYDLEEILHTVNYASLGSDKKESAKHKRYKDKVLKMLTSILPSHDEVEEIEISVPKVVSNILRPGSVNIKYKKRKDVTYSNLSLGYKSVLALAGDISWRLFNEYPDSGDPLKESAIVILDEVDLHLHPLWQREIIHKLSDNFPNVQFIATAHSPLIVQAALDANFEILKEIANVVMVISDTENIDGWRIDQILTSDFFGLNTARGPEIEKKINERRELLKKTHLSANEKQKLDILNNEIYDLPVGNTKSEVDAMQLLKSFSKKLEEIKAKKNDPNS